MNLRSVGATIGIGTGAIVLLVVAAWILLLGPTLSEIGETDEARADALDRNTLMSVQLAQLQEQADQLGDIRKQAAELTSVFPATADQPGFFAQVTAAARKSGIAPEDVTSLSPGVPQLVQPSTPPVDPAADPAAAPEVVAELATQAITVVADGSYAQLTEMLAQLEGMDRAFLTTSVSVDGSEGELSLLVTGTTFVAPPLVEPARGGS